MPTKCTLILDFDGTLTERDTTEQLSCAGLAWQASRGRIVPDWAEFSESYMADLATLNASLSLPAPFGDHASTSAFTSNAHTLENEPSLPREGHLNPALRTAIHSHRALGPIENRSAMRVSRSAFPEWPAAVIRRTASDAVLAGRVVLRPGAVALVLHAAGMRDVHVEILSAGWSRAWIRGCIAAGFEAHSRDSGEDERAAAMAVLEGVHVTANETPFVDVRADEDAEPRCNSPFTSAVRTSADKRAHFVGAGWDAQASGNGVVVYVGDTTADAECLLSAEVGICVRDEPMRSGQRELASMFEKDGGLSVEELVTAREERLGQEVEGKDSLRLRYVKDMTQVLDWLNANFGEGST